MRGNSFLQPDGGGVSWVVARSEFEAISGDRLSEQKWARSVGVRTCKTCELTDTVNLYFQSPSTPPSECPSRATRIMRRAPISSSLKQEVGHIIKVTPVRSHLRLLRSMSWTHVRRGESAVAESSPLQSMSGIIFNAHWHVQGSAMQNDNNHAAGSPTHTHRLAAWTEWFTCPCIPIHGICASVLNELGKVINCFVLYNNLQICLCYLELDRIKS